MASVRHTFVVALSIIITVLLLALSSGCQSKGLVQNVPPPSFNGPVVTAEPQPRIAFTPAPSPTKMPSAARSNNGIPKEWIPFAAARSWKWIVVHHSATARGSASVFDRMHKDKGWDELGYDFVIGNGTDSADGQIEVGPRWPKQKWGAHAKTPDNRYNERGIGICLVGNFDESRPTPAQMQSLARLSAYLMKTYRIKPADVIGHGDTKATDCPGKYMNIASLRRQVSQLADASTPDALAGENDLTIPQPAAHTAAVENTPPAEAN